MNPLPKILKMLEATAKTPQMFSYSVETMLMRISTLLEVSGIQFSVVEFYAKHGGRKGNILLMEKPADVAFDDWTKQVVDDAIKMIETRKEDNA